MFHGSQTDIYVYIYIFFFHAKKHKKQKVYKIIPFMWFQGHAFVYAGYVSARLLVYLFDFENVVSSNIIPVRGGKYDNSENHSLNFIWLTYAAAWVENLPTAAMSERLYSVFEFGGSEELFQDFFGCAVAKIEGHIGDCRLLHISNLKARWCRGWHSEQQVHLLSLGFLRVLWFLQWG